MKNSEKYSISFLGEFKDKELEKEFLDHDMRRYTKFIAPVIFLFGLAYMLFIITDYYDVGNTPTFKYIVILRLLVFIIPLAIFLFIKRTHNYADLIYMITGFESIAILSFFGIIYLYESIGYLTFFSVTAITLAIYTIPNKLINAQILSVMFVMIFFIFQAIDVGGLKDPDLWKIAFYNFIIIFFCNTGAYMTNYYKRKQFADSKELLRLSITDPLTGVYSRNKFAEELDKEIKIFSSSGKPLTLVIFDIDNFKRVNDSHGHIFGDNVLQNITSTVSKSIRGTDVFARIGGEEFVILLPNTDIENAKEIIERLRNAIQETEHGMTEKVTCSFGLASLGKNENAESFIRRTDRLLYNAKDLGKNTIVCEA